MTAVHQRDARVVIIDDTPDMRTVLGLMIRRYDGVEIVGEAGDGAAGVAEVRRLQPDLVLLDLAMPLMDGLEALPKIRAAAPTCEVIVLSGFESQQMGMRALDVGAAAYVQKGASPEELIGAMCGVLGRTLTRRERAPRVATTPEPSVAVAATPQRGSETNDPYRVIARVAHELRNPALALSFLAEELNHLVRGETPGPADAVLDAIARQAALVDQLTSDLMTSSHARRGTLAVNPRPIDLAPVLAEAVAGIPDAARDVEVICRPGLTLFADRLRVHQLVTNLVSNALRYGRPPVRVLADDEGGEVVVRIIDEGDGVPEWFRDKLFDEYSRADPVAGAGAGIGLYIVRAIAEAHGGRVWFETRARGACFAVALPMRTT